MLDKVGCVVGVHRREHVARALVRERGEQAERVLLLELLQDVCGALVVERREQLCALGLGQAEQRLGDIGRPLALEQGGAARRGRRHLEAAEAVPRNLAMPGASEASDRLHDVGRDDLPAAGDRALDGDVVDVDRGVVAAVNGAPVDKLAEYTQLSRLLLKGAGRDTRAPQTHAAPVDLGDRARADEGAPAAGDDDDARQARRRPGRERHHQVADPPDALALRVQDRELLDPRCEDPAHVPSTAFRRADAPRNSRGNRAWWTVWASIAR